MVSVSTLLYLKLIVYVKSRLLYVKFHFGHKISYIKSRVYVKLRLYCTLVNVYQNCWSQ